MCLVATYTWDPHLLQRSSVLHWGDVSPSLRFARLAVHARGHLLKQLGNLQHFTPSFSSPDLLQFSALYPLVVFFFFLTAEAQMLHCIHFLGGLILQAGSM